MIKQEIHPRTEIINQKQKNRSKHAKFAALGWLAKRFPEAFDNTVNIRPLKKGILNDVLSFSDVALEAGISKSKLREALVIYTRRIDYLTALKSQEMRVDLYGNPQEPVTEEEAKKASLRIKKMIERSVQSAKKSQSAPIETSNFIKSFSFDANKVVDTEKTQAKTPQIKIKSKLTRKIDPEAVSRLKAKLGLIREAETV